MKALAVIRKVGDKFVVFSKTGKRLSKPLSLEEAKKRLKQIEFFKHQDKKKGKSAMQKINPTAHFQEAMNRQVQEADHVQGTIAGVQSALVIDGKNHFPVGNEDQAISSVHRVVGLLSVPDWFNGNVYQLKQIVLAAVAAQYPNMPVNVRTHADIKEVLAQTMSPKQNHAEMDINEVKTLESNKDKVPGVDNPNLKEMHKKDESEKVSYAQDILAQFHGDHSAVGANLLEMIANKEKQLGEMKKLGTRLIKKGISGKEFESLMGFLQEDILRELLMQGVKASHRKAVVRKVASKYVNQFRGPEKPTDGDKKKKKKK